MVDKIDAARHAQGLIQLERRSAEQIKQALKKVSTNISIEDNLIQFDGQRIIEGHGFALHVNCFDIFKCPNGYLLHTYMNTENNWAITGKTLNDLFAAAPDSRVVKRARGLLIQKNLTGANM